MIASPKRHTQRQRRSKKSGRKGRLIGSVVLWVCASLTHHAVAVIHHANPRNYTSLLQILKPGDTLLLEAGKYHRGLRVHGVAGDPGRPFVIEGPANGEPAVLLGRAGRNTISIRNARYVTIRNLEIDGQGAFVDGVKAEGNSEYAHHITLENLYIHSLVEHQQSVGISTKCPAWDWVVRGNRIEDVGTGMYFGNSDGSDPFVGGLIEDNVVLNTIGYNLQIKHQQPRLDIAGMPSQRRQTIIRRNVFVKAEGASVGPYARPNVLVGHVPVEGPGRDDEYVIYGNIFFQNPREALFQGEGNIALYNNLFFNSHSNEFPAIAIQPHNDIPRRVRIFFNTVVHPRIGIRILHKEKHWVDDQEVFGNAVFAQTPLQAERHSDNVTADYFSAAEYLHRPVPDLVELDLYPQPSRLQATPIDLEPFKRFPEYDRDFNGTPHNGVFRGAYSGEGTNPSATLVCKRSGERCPR